MRIFRWNGCSSAVQLLELYAAVGVNKVGPKGKDLAKLDRQQAHGLYGINIDWFFSLQLPEEAKEGQEFHGRSPLVQSTNSMAFGS